MLKKLSRWFNRPKNSSGHVYYVRLKTPEGIYYKLGFTSKTSLAERLSYGNSGDEKLIDREFFFTYRDDAWDVEQTLLEHFDRHRAFGKYSKDPTKPLCGRGQTELFNGDILGLDEDLYKVSEEERQVVKESGQEVMWGCLFILIGLVLAPFTFGVSLALILLGYFALQEVAKSPHATKTRTCRPTHPPVIQQLIESLSRVGGAAK